MAFLVKDELKTVADISIIDIITNLDDSIVYQIIAESISLMTTYLKPRYNTDIVFAAIEVERHLTVLKYLKDIVIYEIYIRYTRKMNEVALKRYEEAMRWLEKVNAGEFAADLPEHNQTAADGTVENITISYKSNKKYNSIF